MRPHSRNLELLAEGILAAAGGQRVLVATTSHVQAKAVFERIAALVRDARFGADLRGDDLRVDFAGGGSVVVSDGETPLLGLTARVFRS